MCLVITALTFDIIEIVSLMFMNIISEMNVTVLQYTVIQNILDFILYNISWQNDTFFVFTKATNYEKLVLQLTK